MQKDAEGAAEASGEPHAHRAHLERERCQLRGVTDTTTRTQQPGSLNDNISFSITFLSVSLSLLYNPRKLASRTTGPHLPTAHTYATTVLQYPPPNQNAPFRLHASSHGVRRSLKSHQVTCAL